MKDADDEPVLGDFSYSSVVGMLLFLAGHTRFDIAYAVNCCARYMFCPKQSHELALKRIGQYLKATRDCGLVLNPSKVILMQTLTECMDTRILLILPVSRVGPDV